MAVAIRVRVGGGGWHRYDDPQFLINLSYYSSWFQRNSTAGWTLQRKVQHTLPLWALHWINPRLDVSAPPNQHGADECIESELQTSFIKRNHHVVQTRNVVKFAEEKLSDVVYDLCQNWPRPIVPSPVRSIFLPEVAEESTEPNQSTRARSNISTSTENLEASIVRALTWVATNVQRDPSKSRRECNAETLRQHCTLHGYLTALRRGRGAADTSVE